MFSGIIEKTGRVLSSTRTGKDLQLEIETSWRDLQLGESIAVQGACLTVAKLDLDRATFDVSPETLALTCLGKLLPKQGVNLERSLRVGDRNSGHWVQGHVDGMGEVLSVRRLSDPKEHWELEIAVPSRWNQYWIDKGSIAVNGVSLTIHGIQESPETSSVHLRFVIVPHTWLNTQFHALEPRTQVNIEIDVLAKYIERLCQPHLSQRSKQD